MPRAPRKQLEEPAAPRLRRTLPHLVTDVVLDGRNRGQRYHYTSRDIRAIVQYVSEATPIPANAFTPTDWAAVDRQRDNTQRARAQYQSERDREQQQRTLEARLSGPSIASRIAAAEASTTFTPIAPTPVSGAFNFERLTTDDLLEIVGTKLVATRRRLTFLDEIPIPDDTNPSHALAVDRLRHRLQALHAGLLRDSAPDLTNHQWTQLNWCLKSIGDISFARVRSRYARILAELAAVSNSGHLVWVPVPAELTPTSS